MGKIWEKAKDKVETIQVQAKQKIISELRARKSKFNEEKTIIMKKVNDQNN